MIRRPPRSTPLYSSAASDVYKRQALGGGQRLNGDYIKPSARRGSTLAVIGAPGLMLHGALCRCQHEAMMTGAAVRDPIPTAYRRGRWSRRPPNKPGRHRHRRRFHRLRRGRRGPMAGKAPRRPDDTDQEQRGRSRKEGSPDGLKPCRSPCSEAFSAHPISDVVRGDGRRAVSYTHLTLPTNREV